MSTVNWQIDIAVVPRATVPPEALYEASGTIFALWPVLVERLRGGLVNFSGGQFVLHDAEGSSIDITSDRE
jgi:hypothetical protein